MHATCEEMPWIRTLRAVALILALMLGLELTHPLGGYAQPSQGPASAPAVSVENQDLPPMQEAEIIEVRKPFYKKWWFWTLVGGAVVGGAAIALASGGGNSSTAAPAPAAPAPGDVNVSW